MRSLILEIAAASALTLGAILALATGARASDVMVVSAFARASATPAATAGVAYVSLANHSAEADKLVGITTAAAEMAGLHESKTTDGVASMVEVPSLNLPPGATIAMAPGGLHIMLMGLKAPLKQGATLHLNLTFEKAGHLAIDVPVKGVAATGP